MTDSIWIPTYSGREINLMDPNPDDIMLEDIAHHLALQNRYLGSSIRPYSVAEHSVRLAYAVTKVLERMNGDYERPYWGREALLHDGLEAYTGDLPRSLVLDLTGSMFETCQQKVDTAVRQRFHMDPSMGFWLRDQDRAICQVEIQSGLFNKPYRGHCLMSYHGNGSISDAQALSRELEKYDCTWFGSSRWGWDWKRAEFQFMEAARSYGIQ